MSASCPRPLAWDGDPPRRLPSRGQLSLPKESAPRYLIRDRDGIFGAEVRRCLARLNSEEGLTAAFDLAKGICSERRVVKLQAVSSVAPSSVQPVVGSSEDTVSAAAS
jgi:hypothetical protein